MEQQKGGLSKGGDYLLFSLMVLSDLKGSWLSDLQKAAVEKNTRQCCLADVSHTLKPLEWPPGMLQFDATRTESQVDLNLHKTPISQQD